MEFKVLDTCSDVRMKLIISFIKEGKLKASTIIRVLEPDDSTKYSNYQIFTIEIWRAEGGVDMFGNPINDIFDKVTIIRHTKWSDYNGEWYDEFDYESCLVGLVTEDDLKPTIGTLFISESVLTDENFAKAVSNVFKSCQFFETKIEDLINGINDARYNNILRSFTIDF